MLDAYRVIDLTDERGQLAGMILGFLGADVVAVEPPEGTASRRVGPFAGDVEDPERSLVHWAYNRAKRSVVADPRTEAGRAALAALLAGADVLLDSGHPGHLAGFGLDREQVAARYPALVHVAITPYGADGPKAAWPASDLTVNAASGQQVLTGDGDRAPLRISAPPQTYLQAAGDAAGAALIALAERRRSGLGQFVDVSAQTSMMASTQEYALAALVRAPLIQRAGGGVLAGGLHIRLVWPCRDGHVSLLVLFGPSLGPFSRRLFEWMEEEGACTAADRDKDWINLGLQLWSGEEPTSEWERLRDLVAAFVRTKTKAELMAAALERKVLFAPLTTPAELAGLAQLETRGYWDDVATGAGTFRFPGPFCRFGSGAPPRAGRPPRLGEHSAEVLATAADRRPATAAPVTATPDAAAANAAAPNAVGPDDGARAGLPLAGLKVLDLMWAVAGPSTTRVLADYGATVVKVESQHSMDGARTVGPFLDDTPGPENTALWHSMAAGKLGLALDLSKPEARAVVLDLVRWADVVTESFSPRAMTAWGLGYAELRKVNPRLIMVSSCLMGQSGPLALYAGFGTMAAAICGFHHLTGWPDRDPVGAFSAYTDYVAPRFTLPALLAALEHRERTGEGQHLDFSQLEASLHLLAPALLDWTVNGRVADRQGNDDPRFAPHGVYATTPSAGAGEINDQDWVAVVCETDAQWRALAALVGRPELGDLDVTARRARRRELDDVVGAWTAGLGVADAEKQLLAADVPAHRMQSALDCAVDPQLAHRGAFLQVAHEVHGTTWVEGSRFRLSRTPAVVERAGPTFGQDLEHVLGDLLGYDVERIAELAAAEVLE